MSDELGLKNTFKERIYGPLQAYRGNDGSGGREISFIDFCKTRAINEAGQPVGLKNTSGQPIEWDDVWNDLGLDPACISLNNLISYSGTSMAYLAPEIVRDFILKGMESEATYQDLVAGTEAVDSLTVTTPWIKFKDETPVATAQAATIAEADIEWGQKTVKVSKNAIGIHWTDELLLSVRLPLLQYFLRKLGVALAAKLYTDAVTVMINGDQADSSDNCAIIGSDTGTATEFKDFLRAWIRARAIGMRWDNLINNEATAWKVLQIAQFSDPAGAGTVRVRLESVNRIIPAAMPHLISSALTNDYSLLFDRSMTMIHLLFRGLLVENERIVSRQIQGTFASIISGWATIDRTARIIINGATAYSGAAFPSWMAPIV